MERMVGHMVIGIEMDGVVFCDKKCILVSGTAHSTFLNAAELNHILAPMLILVLVPRCTVQFYSGNSRVLG
jgi:hypothetical protein